MFLDPPSTRQAIVAYTVTAVAVGAFAWVGSQFDGSIFWPAPLMMVIPAWLIGQTLLGNIDTGPKLIPLIGSLPFIIVGIPLLIPKSRVMWPTMVLCLTLAIASVAYFATSWTHGIEYQGITYTAFAAVVNLGIAAACFWLTRRALRGASYWRRYVAAVVPCLWLAWCAFPWLGEMP
jgi:hypothetical protein